MEVRLPPLAENVSSGTIVKILVAEGERVQKGQDLLELETEKAVAAVPSPEDGLVTRVHVKDGDDVSVGQVIFSLSEEQSEAKAAKKPRPAPEAEVRERQAPPASSREQVVPGPIEAQASRRAAPSPAEIPGFGPPASPTVRRLALQLGIDLTRVRGTEHGGRIVIDDLRDHIERLQQLAYGAAEAPAGRPEKKPAAAPTDFEKWGPVHRQPMTATRKSISEAMSASWSAIPHVTQFQDADVSRITALLKQYGPQYQTHGARLTLTGVLIKLLVPILKQHPIFNSSIDLSQNQIVFKDHFHFGIAVDTEQGLLVPVIRDVDRKSLLEISKSLKDLAERTRERRITLDELRGGTFTISNQGGIGGGYFTPIIHAPEVAILGVGRSVLKPVVADGKVESRWILPLGLSYDHRAIDGAQAARFVHDLATEIESFNEETLKLPASTPAKSTAGKSSAKAAAARSASNNTDKKARKQRG